MEENKQLNEQVQPEQVAVENIPSNAAEGLNTSVSVGGNDLQEQKAQLPDGVQKRIATLTRRLKEETEKRQLAEKAIQANYAQGQPANFGSQAPSQGLQKPDRTMFADPYEYAEALVKYKDDQAKIERQNVEQQLQQANLARYQKTLVEQHQQRALEFSKEYSDYNDTISKLDISNDHVTAIQTSPKSAEIAYYLGKNPDEALEFSLLNPIEALVQVGRYTEKFAKKSVSNPSSAKPMQPLSAGTPASPSSSKNSISALRQKFWKRK